MDDAIGQVMDALDRKGVLDDTLVMFLNDNGGTQSAGWNEPYRGKKSGFYEGGIRVPAVLRWPGQIPAGSESDALLHVVDLFPTFAGLAGADTDTGLSLDGLDAWEVIAEGAESPRDEVVYALGVIRVGDWKLIEEDVDYYDPAPGSVLLYNIKEDPYEQTNRAAAVAAVAGARSVRSPSSPAKCRRQLLQFRLVFGFFLCRRVDFCGERDLEISQSIGLAGGNLGATSWGLYT